MTATLQAGLIQIDYIIQFKTISNSISIQPVCLITKAHILAQQKGVASSPIKGKPALLILHSQVLKPIQIITFKSKK